MLDVASEKLTERARECLKHRGWLAAVVACLTTVIANAAGGAAPHLANVGNGAAGVLLRATDLGPMSSSSPIELTVWLKLRDSAGLDRTLEAQRTDGAGWLSEEQIDQLHAPGAADVAAIGNFLKAQGLTVTGVGPHDLFVKARGTVAAVDAAFKVQLHQYSFRGTTFHASSAKPTLPANIAPLIVSVGGLSNLPATPMIVLLNPGTFTNVEHASDAEGLPRSLVPLSSAAAAPQGLLFSSQCFYPPTTVSFSSSTATASYSGGRYGPPLGTLPCGYQPSDLQTAYNLTPLYKAGLDGTGETIAIIDAYGSTTLQQDLATFSALTGLPPPKLQILGTPTASLFSSDPLLSGWAGETTGDAEMVHSIAPGATILVVVALSQSLDDLMAANLTAAQQPGVVSISNSWAYWEAFTDLPTRTATDGILKLAISKGISVNFSSGDNGNGATAIGVAAVSYPASSPYATSVGGVSVALDPSKHILFQTSWGHNLTLIAGPVASGSPPVYPPAIRVTLGGGGGVSDFYPLPRFQAFLRRWGSRRLVPDISWVADPFTGPVILGTVNAQGEQSVGIGGGTSIACPMFSALWGIAVQKAKRPLGQAAPLLYTLPPGAITDVVAPIPFANVTGTLTDASGTLQLTEEDLAAPLQGLSTFLSTLYNSPGTTDWYVLTFGLTPRCRQSRAGIRPRDWVRPTGRASCMHCLRSSMRYRLALSYRSDSCQAARS